MTNQIILRPNHNWNFDCLCLYVCRQEKTKSRFLHWYCDSYYLVVNNITRSFIFFRPIFNFFSPPPAADYSMSMIIKSWIFLPACWSSNYSSFSCFHSLFERFLVKVSTESTWSTSILPKNCTTLIQISSCVWFYPLQSASVWVFWPQHESKPSKNGGKESCDEIL